MFDLKATKPISSVFQAATLAVITAAVGYATVGDKIEVIVVSLLMFLITLAILMADNYYSTYLYVARGYKRK